MPAPGMVARSAGSDLQRSGFVFPARWLGSHPAAARRAALELLDQVSRPLTAGEIEGAIRSANLTRAQRRAVVRALARFEIIALVDRASPAGDQP